MQQQIIKCLQGQETYQQTIPFRKKVLDGDRQLYLPKQVRPFNPPYKLSTPMSRLMAVKYAQDTMDLFDDSYVSQFQYQVLPRIEDVCYFRSEEKQDDRGRFMFTNKPDQEVVLAQIGNSMLRLSLECMWVWSKWFPIDPDTMMVSAYKFCVERMIIQKVKFPQLIYFDPGKVIQQVPDCLLPLTALHQCHQVIKHNLKKSTLVPYRKIRIFLLNVAICIHEKHRYVTMMYKAVVKYRKQKYRQSIVGLEQTPKMTATTPVNGHGDPNNQQTPWISSRSSSRPLDQFRQISEQFKADILFLDAPNNTQSQLQATKQEQFFKSQGTNQTFPNAKK